MTIFLKTTKFSPQLQLFRLFSLGGLEDLVALLVGLLILCSTRRRFFSGLYTIPGLRCASISRAWRIREFYNGHVEETELVLHEKYGVLCS